MAQFKLYGFPVTLSTEVGGERVEVDDAFIWDFALPNGPIRVDTDKLLDAIDSAERDSTCHHKWTTIISLACTECGKGRPSS